MSDALSWALSLVEGILPYAIVVALLRYTVRAFTSAAFGRGIRL